MSENNRLYEPGPLMMRIMQEANTEDIQRFQDLIEVTEISEYPSHFQTFKIDGVQIEFLCARMIIVEKKIITVTSIFSFDSSQSLGRVIEAIRVEKHGAYKKDAITSTVEIRVPDHMAETHRQSCLGMALGNVIDCQGITDAIKDFIIINVKVETDSDNKTFTRFVLDDRDRCSRIAKAHYPKTYSGIESE
jgi:hypothetical protein